MNVISYRIGLRRLNHERDKVVKDISKLKEDAKKTGGAKAAEEVWQSESFRIDMVDNKLLGLVTQYLLNKANKRFLPVPTVSEESGMWERNDFTGGYHLTDKGISEIRRMVRQDMKESIEIFTPYVTTLFGLIGAVTGLIAVIKK
jgi:hypothetical protein